MLTKVLSAALQALDAILVTVEVHSKRGMKFTIVGLPDNAVKESHERIVAAIVNSGMPNTTYSYLVNMAPADVRKEGARYDLPIAIGMLASGGHVSTGMLADTMMIGELGLDGTVRAVNGALSIAILARKLKVKRLLVPGENAKEASVVNNLEVYGVDNLRQVVDFLNGTTTLEPTVTDTRAEFEENQKRCDVDFADVKGHWQVKRAMEVAAAGGHNLIMVGSPGSGKTMLARRLPTILPPLTLRESLETTQIYSIASKLPSGSTLMYNRPFCSPHHTISQAALCGGGSNARPGEISLAHNGVLFCDELPEFSRSTLEVLRQPLEERKITISRAKYSVEYPCAFMFVASMNPCPCGYYNDPARPCTCSPGAVQKYLGKVSGPLLDRIDIQIEVSPVSFDDMVRKEESESSATIRARVVAVREVQAARFQNEAGVYCNAQMNSRMMNEYMAATGEAMDLLGRAMKKFNFSARAFDRILRVARTIADLDHSSTTEHSHVAEAIRYRNMDRSTWGYPML